MNSRKLLILIFVTSLKPFVGISQPANSGVNFFNEHSSYPAIYEQRKHELEVEVDKGKPVVKVKEASTVGILAENSKAYSEITLYFNSREKDLKLEAYSILPGKSKKNRVSNFIKSAEINDGLFYDDMISYTFSFPEVKKGSRLYTCSESIVDDLYYPHLFFFGRSLPCEEASFSVTFPKSVKISYKLFGGPDTCKIEFVESYKKDLVTYKWKVTNIGTYEKDFQSPSNRYFTPHIILQISGYEKENVFQPTMGSLDDLYRWCYSKIKNLNAVTSQKIKTVADSITKEAHSEKEKVKSIFSWVQKNIKYVAIEDGENGFVPREAEKVLQRRYGDCKDKTSVITSMLKSQGIPSSFAWVGTRELPYKYSDFASISVDNHMVAVWWDSLSPVVLDGTSLHHKMEDIPAFIQGKQCLIAKNSHEYEIFNIPVAPPRDNSNIDTLFINVKDDLLRGRGNSLFSGEIRANVACSLDGADPAKIDKTVSGLYDWASNKLEVSNSRIRNLESSDIPLEVDFDFELPDYISVKNEMMYVNLNIDRMLQDLVVEADRRIPVESEMTFFKRYVGVLNIPLDYGVKFIPKSSEYGNSRFHFSQNYKYENDQIFVINELMINFQTIDSNEIQEFHHMLKKLNRSYLNSVVLSKN